MSERSRNHLDLEQRKSIERLLYENKTVTQIAYELDVAPSTISREIKRNRRDEGISHASIADKTDCDHLKSCTHKGLCGYRYPFKHRACEDKLCKRCAMVVCEAHCPDYKKRLCKTTERAPFVCNACAHFGKCTLNRYKYSAQSAWVSAHERNREARTGFDLTQQEVTYLIEVIRRGLKLGHSIHHIFMANEMPCSERTFYRLVEDEKIEILNIELAKKVKYKKRKGTKTGSVHARGFYRGHEYKDYQTLSLSLRRSGTEVDTVWGAKKDKQCILSLHRIDLHFQIYLLLQEKTTACVVKAFDWLEDCSEGRFSEFFGLILMDRGSEFDDIEGMERSVAQSTQRTSVYFTDPNRPDQKGSCEKNHVELRKVIPKGTSLENMDASTLATICSHVNSTIRKGCGNTTPLELAQMCLPQKLLENLGLSLISPNEVIAAPGILYDPCK